MNEIEKYRIDSIPSYLEIVVIDRIDDKLMALVCDHRRTFEEGEMYEIEIEEDKKGMELK